MVLYSRKYQVLRHSACSKRNSVFQLLKPTHLVASNLDQLLGYGSAIMRPMIRSSIRCSISPSGHQNDQTMTMETSELQTFRIDFTNSLRSAS